MYVIFTDIKIMADDFISPVLPLAKLQDNKLV
jgi:hypothetical protein